MESSNRESSLSAGGDRPAQRAGQATLPHWRNDVAVTEKADASPVTAADLAAHDILASGLRALAPEIPVLSEEDAGIPFAERAEWQRWWLVDPLDGTKEFISGSEEFTVNVALIERGRVVFGVVGVPLNGRCYFGGAGLGAWRQEAAGEPEAIAVRLAPPKPLPWWPASATPARRRSACSPVCRSGLLLCDLQLANIGSPGSSARWPKAMPTAIRAWRRLPSGIRRRLRAYWKAPAARCSTSRARL